MAKYLGEKLPAGKNLGSSISLQTFYAEAQMLIGIISETSRFAERFMLKSIKQIQDSVTRSPSVNCPIMDK